MSFWFFYVILNAVKNLGVRSFAAAQDDINAQDGKIKEGMQVLYL